jgi:radical SAM superfamily enzyme YgiQ (UPF0313 family)
MKVLVLNPPFFPKFSRASRSPAVTKGGTIYYCIWLAYATGVLEKEGFEVKLVDAPARGLSLEETIKIAEEFKPELLVMDTSTPSIHNDLKVLQALKERIECFALLVGTHVSALPEHALNESKKVDAVARHEYDYIVRDIAIALRDGKDWRNIKGISFKEGNSIRHNEDMPLIENLDELPFVSEVYKKHLNIKDYFYSANLYPEITIVTGRGCPNQCKFCVWPQVFFSRKYRSRSVDSVVEEFEYIKKSFPEAKEVFIEDDTFTINKARVREFCQKILGKKTSIEWSCNARADVDLETLKEMKKAKCRLLCVGFESGVQEILNNIHKGTKIDVIKQFMKDTKKAGILVHGCFMLGNQGETKETIMKTIEFAKELNPDTAQFFPIMVYPGTETFEWARENGFLITEDYSKWLDEEGCHNCMVSRPGLTAEELVELCNLARKKFYFRPSYMASKAVQVITQPKETKRIMKSAKTFFKHAFK